MKAVILAGGLGTRITEETHLKPKPMIEIGGKPILWHIMKIYSHHGINEFVICCGYKGYLSKEYFANYFLHMSDITIDIGDNSMDVHAKKAESWKVTLVDTGEHTLTGGRLKRVSNYLDPLEPFCFTYGDGLSNVNVTESIKFHKKHKKMATITAVQPPGRYGALDCDGVYVKGFKEKPSNGGLINGGFFILEPNVIDLIEGDSTIWEEEPLNELASRNEMVAFNHTDFWQPMDTLREKQYLEGLWESNKAPWKVW